MGDAILGLTVQGVDEGTMRRYPRIDSPEIQASAERFQKWIDDECIVELFFLFVVDRRKHVPIRRNRTLCRRAFRLTGEVANESKLLLVLKQMDVYLVSK